MNINYNRSRWFSKHCMNNSIPSRKDFKIHTVQYFVKPFKKLEKIIIYASIVRYWTACWLLLSLHHLIKTPKTIDFKLCSIYLQDIPKTKLLLLKCFE